MERSSKYRHWTSFLNPADATSMMALAESFGSFGTYADEATSDGLGEQLPQRFDVGTYYFDSGIDGTGNTDDAETAASRSNYFRETYAYGDDILAPGIEVFMNNPQLQQAAIELSGCELVHPGIVYANFLVPGQELAIHTDVPEFRGANRKNMPQWLLVCMLLSGLFDRWRIPILTCVSWWGEAQGGAFTFYPEGARGVRDSVLSKHNTAIILDTDKVFHGVERVAHQLPDLPPIGQNTRLHFCGGESWQLREGNTVLADYLWSQIRYSISWKAYCFEDVCEHTRWLDGSDDLSLEIVLDTLEQALRDKAILTGPRPSPTEFAVILVETFINFPGMAGKIKE